MKFSIKNRVEILISRDRIPAAIGKLKSFTKSKNEHNEVYIELCELEGQYVKNKKLWSAKTIEYVDYNREESRIRARILDINNEIEALKETTDRKALWNIFWIVLTGILIPILLVFLPRILDRKEFCPDFDDKPCKFLIFDFNEPSNFNDVASEINTILQEDEKYRNMLTSRKYKQEGSFAPDEIEDQMKLCGADFALTGSTIINPSSDLITVKVIPYPRDSQLADYVNVKRDTIQFVNIDNLLNSEKYQIMLQLLVCDKCGCSLPESEIKTLANNASPNEKDALYSLLASYQYKSGDLISAESTLTTMITSFVGSIRKYAMRGKVRDDLKKYEPAFEDYSMYLEEVPENHTVRMRRFNSAYNLLTTSAWQNRYGEYVDVAENDLRLLRNHITQEEYAFASRRLQELKDLRDKNVDTLDDTQDTKACVLDFRVKHADGSPVSGAAVSITGMNPMKTNSDGVLRFAANNCDDILNKELSVFKDGFLEANRTIRSNNLTEEIVLEAIQIEQCNFSGIVRSRDNKPISQSTIEVPDIKQIRVDREGQFVFEEIECDKIIGKEFIIKAPGYLPYVGIVRKEKPFIDIRLNPIVIEEEMCSYSGYILSSEGKAIENASISFEEFGTVLTRRDGYFETEKINCVEWAGKPYSVTAEGYETIRNVIKPGNFKITHRLKENSRTIRLTGRIMHKAFNLPVAGVSVILDNEEVAKTNKNGDFVVERMVNGSQPATSSITFTRRGYHNKTVSVNANEDEDLRVVMTPMSFSGKVVDEDGKPVEKAKVSIRGLRSTTTNSSGKYSFDIKEGFSFPTSIIVSKDGYHEKNVSIDKGSEIQLVAEFKINLLPLTFQYLHVIVQKEEYSERLRKWIYVPAVGAKVFIDNKEVGTIPKDGLLKVNLTGRLNQTVILNVKNANQQAPPGLPMKVRFTKNGQEVVIKYYVIK